MLQCALICLSTYSGNSFVDTQFLEGWSRYTACLNVSQHALERSDYPLRPPAPQEKKLRFSRVADIIYPRQSVDCRG